ncbi:DNA repair exonuclease SbcCD ATPase subunit [Sphingomonas sp. F9_3S_D5_B_2]
MIPSPQRSEPLAPPAEDVEPLELDGEIAAQPTFDTDQWAEAQSAGGRQVLGAALTVIAALWLAYTAWSAGRSLGGQPLSSPLIAQWVAIAAGPLALLGLVWLMFGRTRRKESERFTQSVIAMRSEARSLDALLAVLSQRISDSRSELTTVAQQLMRLGDDASDRLSGITRQFESSSDRLARHGSALDRAAESARTDIAVLLDDLPRAEAAARGVSEQLRTIASESTTRAGELGQQVAALAQHTRDTETSVDEATRRLTEHLATIDTAGASAADRLNQAEKSFSGALDLLLDRTVATLDQIRAGMDAQSAAVSALVHQASAGIGRAGAEAAEGLAGNLDRATESIEGLSGRVAEQERASQRMIAEIDRGLAMIDERFTHLASQGDARANRFLESLARARAELDQLGSQAGTQEHAIGAISERTALLRESIEQLADEVRERVGTAIGEAQGSTDRLIEAAAAARPDIGWVRDAAVEASERIAGATSQIGEQHVRFAGLLADVDDGVGNARSRIEELAGAIAGAQSEAASLSAETAPALVAALMQVKDAASHAAERARESIEAIIPASAGKLSQAAREALEKVIRESIEERLRSVETVAAIAVDSARAASERLTQQVMSLGQSALALEQHMEETSKEQREKDSEAFARRVSMLIDSMHSAAIDVGKILSDEVDERAWDSYLKGNRGVFTRRAVRLLNGSETRAIRAHYDAEPEFQQSVNRYIHDFEAMLRRVLAERDGAIIAVTLMSSDMGKLYAALAESIKRGWTQ